MSGGECCFVFMDFAGLYEITIEDRMRCNVTTLLKFMNSTKANNKNLKKKTLLSLF